MSVRCNCPCENPINCPLKSAPDICALNTPLQRQVFGLAQNYPYPPFHQKKLTNREVRDGVDKNELWFYTPPWQVPRVENTCMQCRRVIMRNISMNKIICMARKNMAFNGSIGELNVSISHFGKAKQKWSSKEAYRQCQRMKIEQNARESVGKQFFVNNCKRKKS